MGNAIYNAGYDIEKIDIENEKIVKCVVDKNQKNEVIIKLCKL